MVWKNNEKTKQYHKIYGAKWYKENSEYRKIQIKKRKSEIKNWFYEYKSTLKCSNCSETDPRCLDFNHKLNVGKVDDVSQLVSRASSKEKILKEIEKCIVLCANCHRKTHNGNRWDK